MANNSKNVKILPYFELSAENWSKMILPLFLGNFLALI